MAANPSTVTDYRRELARVVYLELGSERSFSKIREVWSERGLPGRVPAMSSLSKWSSREQWVRAAEQFDEEARRRALEVTLEHVTDATHAQQEAARIMLAVGRQRLRQLLTRAFEVQPRDLPAYIKTATEIQRMTMGADSDRAVVAHELSARLWSAFNQVLDRPDLPAAIRSEMRSEFRQMMITAVTSDEVSTVPDWLAQEHDEEALTAQERSVVSLALEAERRGMEMPDFGEYPQLSEGA